VDTAYIVIVNPNHTHSTRTHTAYPHTVYLHLICPYPHAHRPPAHNTRYIDYGEAGGDSIMAKTVGLTAAIGAEMVLNGTIKSTGVLVPTDKAVYNPALDLLEKEGIVFDERTIEL